MLSSSDVDYLRAELLATRPALAAIVLRRPPERIFEFAHRHASRVMRPADKQAALERHLDALQCRFHDLRAEYLLSKRPEQLRSIARDLPRIGESLAGYATGFLGAHGERLLYALCFEPESFAEGEGWEGIEGAPCAYCAALIRARATA